MVSETRFVGFGPQQSGGREGLTWFHAEQVGWGRGVLTKVDP